MYAAIMQLAEKIPMMLFACAGPFRRNDVSISVLWRERDICADGDVYAS
jgi:hypothetical protein